MERLLKPLLVGGKRVTRVIEVLKHAAEAVFGRVDVEVPPMWRESRAGRRCRRKPLAPGIWREWEKSTSANEKVSNTRKCRAWGSMGRVFSGIMRRCIEICVICVMGQIIVVVVDHLCRDEKVIEF